MGHLGLDFRFLLEFSFQDITWQDEHSAPFSWETRVSRIKFRFACSFEKNCIVVYFSFSLWTRKAAALLLVGPERQREGGAGDEGAG